MIEYVEECALGLFFPDKFLDVVDYECVNALIELDELIDLSS